MSHYLLVGLATAALLAAATGWAWVIILRPRRPTGAEKQQRSREPRDEYKRRQ